MNKELIDRNSIGTQLCEGLACCECSFGKEFDRCMLEERLKELPTERAIPKADYEARLKADLKAILVELQLRMQEYEPKWVENDEQAVASCRTWEDLDEIIQQKIDSLKAESEDKE